MAKTEERSSLGDDAVHLCWVVQNLDGLQPYFVNFLALTFMKVSQMEENVSDAAEEDSQMHIPSFVTFTHSELI